MIFPKRLCGYSESPPSREVPTSEDPEDERTSRIIKREILQSHRARPALAENLVLAAESGPRMDAVTAPSMECIFEILQFSKRMKWLCPWGPDFVDESLRPPSAYLPKCIEQKSIGQFLGGAESLAHETLRDLLSDPSQHWDRIILARYDPEYFQFLHLHPCQEIWLEFDDVQLTLGDMLNIAKCKDLRLFDMGFSQASTEGIRALANLPNLKQVVFDETAYAFPCIKALMELPWLTLLQINEPDSNDYDRFFCPFMWDQIDTVARYLKYQTERAREIQISGACGRFVLSYLGKFSHVRSISIEDTAIEVSDMEFLFKHKNLHKTVRHISLSWTNIGPGVASSLSMFTNLLWLEFEFLLASSDRIAPVILANADNLLTLSICRCRNVGDGILDVIAACKRLQVVDLDEVGVSLEAVENYRAAQRPNWDKLKYRNTNVAARIAAVM